MNTEIVVCVIKVILYIIIGFCTLYVVPLISDIRSKYFNETVEEYVVQAVKAAELLFTGSNTGTTKKNYVKELLVSFCSKFGLTLSDEDIDVLIESAVNDLKLAQKNAEK
jgi:hypothetical protein